MDLNAIVRTMVKTTQEVKWCFVKLYYRVDLAVGDVCSAMATSLGHTHRPDVVSVKEMVHHLDGMCWERRVSI